MKFPAFLSQPINRLLVISMVVIALLPLVVIGVKIYRVAWDDAWREIYEKHRLLALNLASPISIYVDDHRAMLAMLDELIDTVAPEGEPGLRNTKLLTDALNRLNGYQSLILMDGQGHAQVLVPNGNPAVRDARLFADETCYLDTLETGQSQLSGIKRSPLSGEATLLISYPIHDTTGQLIGVILGELQVDLIERLRKQIHFGKGGHSAIVDNRGRVIAHPNPEWMKEMRDLSDWQIIQKMKAGETGVTEFYSSFVKQQMVAGYTAVPEIGWGIMVPQPKSEVEEQVSRLLYAQFTWGLVGLALAVIVAAILARWITRPINALARQANRLVMNGYSGKLPEVASPCPNEVLQLGLALKVLISGLQVSREEVNELNQSLQQRIDKATQQLKRTNAQLYKALQHSDEFVSFARHDLRKPLAVITDVAETMQQELSPDNAKERELRDSLDLIVKSGTYMERIINDFLGQQVLKEGLMAINLEQVRLNDLVRLAIKSNKAYAARKGIELGANVDGAVPVITADGARVAQVLHNLVDNAIKFGAVGDEVVVKTALDGEDVRVEIRDTGPGLSEYDLCQVFNKFGRLSNKPTGGEMSTGLGLAICKQIVELHGGEIGVKNNPQRGATFWFRLPIEVESEDASLGLA